MTLNDLLLTGSLWTEIGKVKNFDFISDNTPATLDLLTSEFFGERVLYHTVVSRSLSDIAKMIVAVHGKNWDSLTAIELQGLPNLGGVNKVSHETITETGTRSNTSDNLNKISAYNTDDLMVNDGSTMLGNENNENTKTRTVSDNGYSVRTAFNNLSLYQKNNIMMVALKDVATFTTLSIY